MIFVAGATGMIGGEVCSLLRAKGERVRGLVRDGSDTRKVDRLRAAGVDIVVGDIRDRDSLRKACTGVRAVVSAVGSFQSQDPANTMREVERQGQINLIDEAKAAGVEHFVPSTYGLRPETVTGDIPLVAAKAAAEDYLIDSGIPYTIIYNGFFMEAWLSPMLGFDAMNARARVYGTGDKPSSWVSFRNVAETIVAVTGNDRFASRKIEISAPEPVAPLDVVRTFEEEGGRTFDVEHMPEEAIEAMAASATDPLHKTVARFFREYARGYTVDVSPVRDELPVRWISIREYARGVYARAGQPATTGSAPE